MLTYNTSLQNSPPYSQAQQATALAALTARSPYHFNQNHQDVMNSLGSQNAAQFDLASTKANTDYQLQQQEAERQLVLNGLQSMAQGQQNQNSLQNERLQTLFGGAKSLLGGLF